MDDVTQQEASKKTEPVRPNPKFSTNDVQRICTRGPSFDDLKQYHVSVKKEAVGRTTREKIAFARLESLGEGMEAKEPNWRRMKEIPFMQLYKGVEERNWRSPLFNPDAAEWKILFFEDRGRLFRPSFNGYRAVVQEKGKEPVWCNLSRPGKETFEEDHRFPRQDLEIPQIYRSAYLGYPSDYGYLQVSSHPSLSRAAYQRS